eukprot:TRINITY_DN1692_c0_g1_i1.p1 TRINITY_DN1692_c0_g1~~TRINITY_DN1692_c0_g1_i1.p1  ORF type:complete len:347 (-),score=40.37 TRINITY_DN1692_c0_g1_i1:196-1236(-)
MYKAVVSTQSTGDKIRTTCRSYRSSLAWCNIENAVCFAQNIVPEEILNFIHSTQGLSTNHFDEISFQTPEDEVGFILIAHGLDFGSGFRLVLHEARNGQGAWLTIRAGLVRMGQQNSSCHAKWLASLTVEEIREYFDLKVETLFPLADQLHTSINEIGTQLLAKGYETPGNFVMSNMTHSATKAVSALVETFPLTFRDEYVVNGQEVCLYKKAQLVVSEMNVLFGQKFPVQFGYSDIHQLTAFVDNVVVAMLRMNNVVQCNEVLAADIAQGKYLIKGSEEEVALRCAALVGVENIVKALAELRQGRGDEGEYINDQKLCNWLWGCTGKEGKNRKYPRHLTPSTNFY